MRTYIVIKDNRENPQSDSRLTCLTVRECLVARGVYSERTSFTAFGKGSGDQTNYAAVNVNLPKELGYSSRLRSCDRGGRKAEVSVGAAAKAAVRSCELDGKVAKRLTQDNTLLATDDFGTFSDFCMPLVIDTASSSRVLRPLLTTRQGRKLQLAARIGSEATI
jgi:hypothetical protein